MPNIPRKKEEVRFDLGAKKPERTEPKIPQRPQKKEEPREDPEVAKQRRIADLKKKAQDAAARAKARQDTPPEEPTPIETSGDMTSAQAAAARRGAPKRAIEDQLDEDD